MAKASVILGAFIVALRFISNYAGYFPKRRVKLSNIKERSFGFFKSKGSCKY